MNRKLIAMIMLGLAAVAFMLPFVPSPGGLQRVEVHRSGGAVVLAGGGGQLELLAPADRLYSADDPYDFFPELIDPASLQRVEFLPYGNSISCNVVKGQGKAVAGDVKSCLAVALRLDVPVYVHQDLLGRETVSLPRNLV